MAKAPALSTAEVTGSLLDHLRQGGYFAASEVPLVHRGAYGADQRADIYAIKLHEFAKKDTRIYEVKVSRSDFVNDVNRDKALGYTAHARRVFYAAPSGLIKPNEVPDGVGLVTMSKAGGWTTRAMPKPGTGEPSVDLMLLLMARGHNDGLSVSRRLSERITLENVELADKAKGIGREVRRQLRRQKSDWDPRRTAADMLLQLVEEATGAPVIDDSSPRKSVASQIRSSEFQRDMEEKARIAIKLLREAKTFEGVAKYLATVGNGWSLDVGGQPSNVSFQHPSEVR